MASTGRGFIVTVLGIVGEAPGEETPRLAGSSAARLLAQAEKLFASVFTGR